MLREFFMKDEIFYRRILSGVYGDSRSLKTSITNMKYILFDLCLKKKILQKPVYELAVKKLEELKNKRVLKRSLGDVTESSPKRHAVTPSVHEDIASKIAAELLMSFAESRPHE